MRDGELVEVVRDGNVAAFASLYRAHVGAVSRVVRDNVHEPEMIADVVQEVFVRALENLPTLRDADRFRPWLLSIARHAAIDSLRSRSRMASDPFDDEAGTHQISGAGTGPDELAELRDLAHLVDGCVAGLSKRDATAIVLVARFDFAPADVAAALGVSVGAAKVIVHRARNRLRDALSLELMVRRKGLGCEDFRRLHDGDEVLAAGRHVRACTVCADLVRSEIRLYDAGTLGRVGAANDDSMIGLPDPVAG